VQHLGVGHDHVPSLRHSRTRGSRQMSTAPTAIKARPRPGDRVFSGAAVFAGSMILVTLAAVAIFLVVQSLPALFATTEDASILPTDFWSYVGPLLFGTVWAAALALIMALPVSIG